MTNFKDSRNNTVLSRLMTKHRDRLMEFDNNKRKELQTKCNEAGERHGHTN